jgi:hypothetical protein
VSQLKTFFWLYDFSPVLCHKNPLPLPFSLPKYNEVQPSVGIVIKEFRLVAFVQEKQESKIIAFAASEMFRIHTKSSQFTDPDSTSERKYRHGKRSPSIPNNVLESNSSEEYHYPFPDWKTVIEVEVDKIPVHQASEGVSFLLSMIERINSRTPNQGNNLTNNLFLQ